ncbi:ABC transporter ATP-binding protein [Candidatus Saccharibacteria bacterium]|nr:ABC transporter ATP-binding protein [Candidatus Saccharibacteria bacterium]
MSKEIAIEVKNLSKHFRLPTEKPAGLKQAFLNWTRGVKGYKKQRVLHDVSFNVEKGDFFGIVGRNGSGKSTLLKLISGIYEPDGGSVRVNGSLVSFIELGVGFNSELTGRENVYLNGALMGFSVKEVDEMYDDIVDFAELGEFMNQKLKNYSSGMQVRLAFSCAIRAKSDILVLDEVLAVGDEAFQRKCNLFFDDIKKDKMKTVVLVTHSMDAVREYCNKAILIDSNKMIINGAPEDIANEYSLRNLDPSFANTQKDEASDSIVKDFKIELLSPKQVNQNEMIEIKISYKVMQDIETNALVSLMDMDRSVSIIGGRTKTELCKKNTEVIHTGAFDLSQINDSTIKIMGEVWDSDGNILCYLPDASSPKFIVRRTDYGQSKAKWAILFDRGKWR